MTSSPFETGLPTAEADNLALSIQSDGGFYAVFLNIWHNDSAYLTRLEMVSALERHVRKFARDNGLKATQADVEEAADYAFDYFSGALS